MSNRCTCCHICHTSVKTSKRSFFPCSSCPSIICRQCVENMREDWELLGESSDWECPRCRDCCPCKRCRNKESNSDRVSSNKAIRRSSTSPEQSRSKQKPKRFRSSSPSSESPPRKKQKISNESMAYPEYLVAFSQTNFSAPTKPANGNTSDSNTMVDRLQKKNEECLDYIGRTERLLQIIREEQDRISSELASLMHKSSVPNGDKFSIPV